MLEAFEVLGPAEWFAVEDADGFEEAVAVEETAVEDRHHRLVRRDQSSFHVAEDGHRTVVPPPAGLRNNRSMPSPLGRKRGAGVAAMGYNLT